MGQELSRGVKSAVTEERDVAIHSRSSNPHRAKWATPPLSSPLRLPISSSSELRSLPAMFPSASLLQPHGSPQLLSSPFLKPSKTLTSLSSSPKPSSSPQRSPASLPLTVRAMRTLQGRVISDSRDKTVAVEVSRLAPHPKYKRRIRMRKTYHAHDPENRFKVGDEVQLEKSRPISKTKTFLAVPIESKAAADASAQDLGIPLQSQS